MKDTYIYLSTCNTCTRIAGDINLPDSISKQELKESSMTEEQIEFLYTQTQSYEALFNKRSQEYRKRGLNNLDLSEKDYKRLLPEHYSFIKRPILIYNNEAYIGNSKKVVAAATAALSNE